MARAFRLAMESDKGVGQVLNVGSGSAYVSVYTGLRESSAVFERLLAAHSEAAAIKAAL